MDPNSAHQLWSSWIFRVAGGRTPPVDVVRSNAARWLRQGFGSVGQARVSTRIENRTVVYVIEARVEGAPVGDPKYVASVKKGFADFVHKGFGPMAVADVEVKIIAGNAEDGASPQQWVGLPGIAVPSV